MSEVKVCGWRVQSHRGRSLSFYGYRPGWAYREDPTIYQITEMVDKLDYDALAAQRDEGLAREAELKDAAEGYRVWGGGMRLERDALQQRLAEAKRLLLDVRGQLCGPDQRAIDTFLASPGCADGEKS